MDNEKKFYAAVLKSGQFVEMNLLEEIQNIPETAVLCFFRARRFSGETSTGHRYLSHLVCVIDCNDVCYPYRKGHYEIACIGPDDPYGGRDITIRDVDGERYFKWHSNSNYSSFFQDEVIPLLDRLDACSTEKEVEKVLDRRIPYFELQEKYNELSRRYDDLTALFVQLEVISKEVGNQYKELTGETPEK